MSQMSTNVKVAWIEEGLFNLKMLNQRVERKMIICRSTVVFWESIIGLEISAQYHIFIILKLEKWMNSED